jgi:hypothetical protein
MLAVILAGCSANSGKIEGTTWTSVPQMIEGRMAREGFLTIQFGTDRSFTYRIGDSNLTGTYSIGSGDKVTFFYSKPIAGKTRHVHTIRVSDEELQISDDRGNMHKFRKGS